MIPKIICFLFGHVWRRKEYLDKQFDTLDPLTKTPCKGNYYVWKDTKRCQRCGKGLGGLG